MGVRLADRSDILSLVALGERFAAYHPVKAPYSPERVAAYLEALIVQRLGVVFVGETDGQIDGVILGTRAPLWYSSVDVAAEMGLWVEPDRRGGRLAHDLIARFEQWAKESGLALVTMSDLCIAGEFPAGALFKRHGYRVVERSHVKEI
jgi:GNAT superfamily N-acetyltransferase